ncbi:hypothetical protein RJ639_041971 [Escallonia herrerae]|uniref:DUF4283 domain-containing protein n=1 Tax=Escallonia herrerae TaxID=1293975 RepID=A0AA88WMQ3_9ASTE|nr:hypothetical protein RJ639_041971 [Escallonia herrerae]
MEDSIWSKLEKIKLTEEEVSLEGENDDKVVQFSWSLLGKLLTSRQINSKAFKETFCKVWNWDRSFKIVDVGPNIFHLRFSTTISMTKVVEGGPWSFDDNLLLVKPWERGMMANNTSIDWIDLWVQLWELPFECFSEKSARVLVAKIEDVPKVTKPPADIDSERFLRVLNGGFRKSVEMPNHSNEWRPVSGKEHIPDSVEQVASSNNKDSNQQRNDSNSNLK